MGSGESPPSETLDRKVSNRVRSLLHPPIALVLGKMTLIYGAVGTGILLICPQFGLTLASGHGLLHWFSLMGPYPCMAACGALFLGSGAVVAGIVLRPEELRMLWPLRLFYFVSFGLLALALFWALGAEIALGLGLAWLVGSVGGEGLAFELGWRYRVRV